MTRIAVLASGRGSNLESLFEKLAGHPAAEIVLVVADRPAEALERARARGVAAAVVAPDDPQALLASLAERAVEWVVLAGYLRKVPPEVVAAYRGRILNVHPALLPRFGGPGMYGERVHRAVLESGEKESGATVHIVDEEYDRGPVVAQRRVPVEPSDTPETLAARVLTVEHELLPEVVIAAAEGRVWTDGERAWVEEERPVRIRRALLSVWDKGGLVELARALAGHGIELVASGGTALLLREAGLAVTAVEEITGAPEFLGGRVKTLHPAVHGAILARRDRPEDERELAERGIRPIDLVVVNLYPFADADEAADEGSRTELIDIGGVALLRAAAKNWRDVAVVTDPAGYGALVDELARRGGTLAGPTRRRLAADAFRLTACYDARIATWLSEGEEEWPERWAVGLELVGGLRYGENPHQAAALYRDRRARPEDLTAVDVLQGKELSYNNYIDAEAARRLVRDLQELDPGSAHCAIVKHTIPCGAASATSSLEAYDRALAADPVSAFGGIVALNRAVDRELAERLVEHFLEVVWAPDFDPEAGGVLGAKKSLRLLAGPLPRPDRDAFELRRVGGGILVQGPNLQLFPEGGIDALAVPTRERPTAAQRADLAFAWAICRAVASNAIVLARDRTTIGVGGGQTNRVGAVQLAVRAARELGHDPAGAVLASDGFFPFPDGIEAAAGAGVTAIIQPGGSVRDGEVVAAADRAGIPMIFTGMRQFRH